MRIAAMLALALFACGDDDSGDGTPFVLTAEAEFHKAACTHYTRCGLYPDEATCATANVQPVADYIDFDFDPLVVVAALRRRVQFNGARVRACLDAIAAAPCDRTDVAYRQLLARCRGFWSGTVAGGEPCVLDEECISQSCTGAIETDQCISGVCVGDTEPETTPAGIGMPCRTDPGCVTGAYCDVATDVCIAMKSAGAACNGADECNDGLSCVGTTGARTCTTLPAAEQPCPFSLCRDIGTYCNQSQVCKPYVLPPTACSGGVARCAPAYVCDVMTGACKPGPRAGEQCQPSIQQCFEVGTVCDSTTQTCSAARADGEPCSSYRLCASGNCDANTAMCAPQPMCF